MNDQIKVDNLPLQVRVIFRDPKTVDYAKMAETTQKNLLGMGKITIEQTKFRKYGLLFIGYGPFADLLRIAENSYQLTQSGGLEIVVTIGEDPIWYIKNGLIHDLREEPENIVLPQFDDEHEHDEDDFNRMGL